MLNSIDPQIKFTVEEEHNGQLSFLDTLVTRDNGFLITNVYRKPTHTDKYLDYTSHHDKNHKVSRLSTALPLLHRAATLPNTNEGKQAESKHVIDALVTNGYPRNFIREVEKKRMLTQDVTPSPEKLVRVFFESVEPSTKEYAVLPYIREPLKRLLKHYDIKVISKPLRTLNQMLPSPKDRPSEEKQTNERDLSNCTWKYIGETGRSLETRKKRQNILETLKNAKLALT